MSMEKLLQHKEVTVFDLNTAIEIAVEAHKGQKQKNGLPYILHPLRLMMQMSTEQEMITAVLHDVVEDSELSFADLKNKGCPAEIITALDCLTHCSDEHYSDYILRIKKNELARRVKLADLRDNMDVLRLSQLTEKDLARLQRYHISWNVLNNVQE